MSKRAFAKKLLQLAKWNVEINIGTPLPDKCVICVAPHTSNWDFILGELAVTSEGLHSGFLMKSTWFFFPLGHLFRKMGGIPVPRKKGSDLTASIVKEIDKSQKFVLAVTPEGTRSYNEKWHKGFLHIAYGARIPIILAYIDYANKVVSIDREFRYTGNADDDILSVKHYYQNIPAKYPEKFGTGL